MNRVHDYFVRGYQRSRERLPPFKGGLYLGNQNTQVQFFLAVHENAIEEASYQSTTCVVLVAYCEHLTELVQGIVLADALKIKSSDLIRAFPEVASDRHDRAELVTCALYSVVRVARSTNFHPVTARCCPGWSASPTNLIQP